MDSTTADRKGAGYKALLAVGALASIAVFLATFLMSAPAVTAVAAAAGTSKTIAWAMVPSVDGLMITGTVVFISRQLRRGSVKYPLTVLLAGIGLSVVCNALHSQHAGGQTLNLKGWAPVVSAIPAVAMALSFHLIADMIKDWLTPSMAAREAAETPAVAPSQTTAETIPALSQTPAETASETTAETIPAASQTPAETTSETRPRRRKTAAETPAETVKAPPLRELLRPLLAADPTLAAPELAERLDRGNTGGLRQTRTAVLLDLAAEGVIEMPAELRPRAVGE
jgi:hypothetical protein